MAKTTAEKHLTSYSRSALKAAIGITARALSKMRLAHKTGRYENIPDAHAMLTDVARAMRGYNYFTAHKQKK